MHKNPVYPNYFADPFVWSHENVFYAIGTDNVAPKDQEKIFPLLRSRDLVSWERLDNALAAPAAELGNTFWAPEVAFADRLFYMYYSVGFEDKSHQIRVAVSESPTGPYIDSGEQLIKRMDLPFAIDPHPFQDDDGQWYLFYARDFLDSDANTRAGTALVVDRLTSMTSLAGTEQVVLRATCDWQRFMRDRSIYGGVYDWHTLEGPCVVKRNRRYYCFFSGGRWEDETYGVDYAVSENVWGPYKTTEAGQSPRVLRTIPDVLIGPGHNSIAKGPDGVSDYIAYHCWNADRTQRQMCIDTLQWTQDGPRCLHAHPLAVHA